MRIVFINTIECNPAIQATSHLKVWNYMKREK